ncbi:hypothetical protein BHAP_2191 [Bifidobacterium hapali]|uniref:Uncharacterized protein n=1 Tax=Bifidobacterium hapali TaxID=1630172 RepID=A0A261FS17_9BIFI|nr:hypothetical protein BHAP_2191 [Bifidobacterium hapali]
MSDGERWTCVVIGVAGVGVAVAEVATDNGLRSVILEMS